MDSRKVQGIVFDIQNYSTFDGPGIRTTVFFKGCPLTCAWCHNPESWKPNLERTWLEERCQSCGICIESCPNTAISFESGKIRHHPNLCTICGACAENCPNEAVEIVGKRLSVEDVVREVLKDKPFYETSGGGVTFSGGEATQQADFLIACLQACRNEEIHTALETCGIFSETLREKLLDLVDLFLFDLKRIDSEGHKHWTGVGNERILENFRFLIAQGEKEKVLARIPVIPGVQTDSEVLENFVTFLKDTRYSAPVHLMPYNRLAKSKWQKTGRGDRYRDFGDLSPEQLATVRRYFEKAGFEVVINR